MDNKPEFLYNVIVSGYYVNLIWPCQYGRFIGCVDLYPKKNNDDITIRFLTLVLVVKDICLTGSVLALFKDDISL